MSRNKESIKSAFDDIVPSPMDNGTSQGRNGMFEKFDNSRSTKIGIAKTSLYLDPDLMIRIKVFCAKNRCKMTSFFTEAAEAYLSANIKEE